MIGVYTIQHQPSRAVYIGSSVQVEQRWAKHQCELRDGRHHCRALQTLWNASRPQEWVHRVDSYSRQEVRDAERDLLRLTNEVAPRLVLNTMKDVVPGLPDAALRSILSVQQWQDPEYRAKQSAAMSAGQRKRLQDPKARAVLAARIAKASKLVTKEMKQVNAEKARAVRNAMLASEAGDELRRKMGAGVKKSWATPKGAAKHTAAIQKGWQRKQENEAEMAEFRAARSAEMKAYTSTPEGRAARSRAAQIRWAKQREKK